MIIKITNSNLAGSINNNLTAAIPSIKDNIILDTSMRHDLIIINPAKTAPNIINIMIRKITTQTNSGIEFEIPPVQDQLSVMQEALLNKTLKSALPKACYNTIFLWSYEKDTDLAPVFKIDVISKLIVYYS